MSIALNNNAVDYISSGFNRKADLSTNTTLTIANSGVVQNLTASATITLPTAAAGEDHIIRAGEPAITVTIQPQSGDTIKGAGLTPVTGAAVTITNQHAGSFVELLGGAANTWVITRVNCTIAN